MKNIIKQIKFRILRRYAVRKRIRATREKLAQMYHQLERRKTDPLSTPSGVEVIKKRIIELQSQLS